MSVRTTKAWTIQGQGSFDNLKYNEKFEVPKLGDSEVLVRLHAASLNYRDLIIPLGKYPFPVQNGCVPGSDGAGEVVETGSQVTRFKKGDKVLTLFNQGHLGGSLNAATLATGLGGAVHGTLRELGTFNENGLVLMPSSLNYIEGATLPCAALTAWNALYGLKPLAAGDTVLTQGTGGVSVFALQFAKAAGATVIATTSSAEKAEVLKKLGADHVINYKETPSWGEKAKELSYRGEGCQHILEVGGNATMAQSLKAVKIDGVISIIGFVGGDGPEEKPQFLEALMNICTVRGILVGNRLQFEEMNASIEANKIKPVVDKKIFKLEELKDAYQYQLDQKHFGKVCVSIE